jgi:glucosamine--fructose-6-phosphate aminotransferase (isomerizing)
MNKFLEEILQQPAALKDTLSFYEREEGKNLLHRAMILCEGLEIAGILFTGMGSSFFSSYLASCLLSANGITAFALNASELLHYHFSLLRKDTVVVGVSQSGESFEVVELMKRLPRGVPSLSVTNEPSSRLAKMGSEVLLSKAGPEEMTSTKSYISVALVKIIFSWALAGKWKDAKKAEVRQLIDDVDRLLGSHSDWMPQINQFFGPYDYMELIGRGPAYSSVLQGALMFKEAVRNPAGGSLGGEFRHGPMEMVRQGFSAVVFAPAGRTFHQSIKMAKDIAGFGGKVMIITNKELDLSDPNIHIFRLSVRDEYLFAIGGIIPVQFMVNARAIELGREPGYFTRGAKITKTE